MDVVDLDGLVEDFLKRTNRKVPFATEGDYDKEDHRNRNGEFHTPSRPEYHLPNGLAVDLRSSIEDAEEKINEIKTERESIQKEMKQLKKSSPKSFIESIEATTTLSAQELKRHGELQDKALKWLFNKGYIVASESHVAKRKTR
ncbi:hypothetical protein NSQ89_15050 [Niallia sp. FSL R7-0648]|uniref:hypothetical protein n=1 Tax=Niallia sp. FSL R7-0648 TaxID=2954521 RepID=UPI0030F6F12B